MNISSDTTNDNKCAAYVQDASSLIASFACSTHLADYDDLVQEASITVIMVLAKFPSASASYVRRSIRNRLVDVYRKSKRQIKTCSLDAQAEDLQGNIDDFVPSPYAVEPLTWLVLKETLLECGSVDSQIKSCEGI